MNSPLNLAVSMVMNRIPIEILELAFRNQEYNYLYPMASISQKIIDTVIRQRVLKDCNVFGGKTIQIVLLDTFREDIKIDTADTFMPVGSHSIFRIPPEARENSSIIEVHGVTYGAMNNVSMLGYTSSPYGGATMISKAQDILDSHTFSSSPPRPLVILMSGEIVKLVPAQFNQVPWILTARISYDNEFTNLNNSAIHIFSQLVLEAVRAYCYNKLIIPIDKSYIESGMQVTTIKTIIDSYAESEKRYFELLDQMAGMMTMDPTRLMNILPYML